MPTYSYKSNSTSPATTIGGIQFAAGVSVSYSYDNLELNKSVPEYLDRYVDSVLSSGLVTTYVPTAQSSYVAQSDVGLTATPLSMYPTLKEEHK